MAKGQASATGGNKRIQMDLPPRSVERLKQLQELTEAASYAEVMRNALRLYEALILETQKGHELLIRRGNTISVLPIFGP